MSISQPRETLSLQKKPTHKQRRLEQQQLEREESFKYVSPNPFRSPDDTQLTLISTLPSSFPTSRLFEMASQVRLLVCSIGNPGPYLNTLHSAGHTVLDKLATSLGYPSFVKARQYGNGLISTGSDFTLWQSTSLMNVSGTGVAAAWRQFNKEGRGEQAKLVVVHDELELALGQVKVKQGSASAKGHNGLKSINGLIKGGEEYVRIGVGIGRPEGREPDIVAKYVLRKMNAQEKAKIEGSVARVEMELRRLAIGA